MFRALFWKEWKQLGLVRWGGIALGALLPVAFIAGAEMAKHGVLPTGAVERYSAGDLMFEILPMALGLGLWPLMALMIAAQGLAGDRAAGTESFLLERPVPRGRTWRARLAASVGSLAVVIAVSAAIGMAIAATTNVPVHGWERWRDWLAGGSAVAGLAFLGGMIASSLLAIPLAAVLGGAILAALPVLLGAELGAAFPYARIRFIPIGTLLPVLMLPAYVLASWAACCRGEPAGRGRLKRGLSIAGLSVPLVLLLFAVAAPITVRAAARSGWHAVIASRSGKTAFVGAGANRWGGGGWIVDVTSGNKIAFLAPPTQSLAWSPDGSKIAVMSWSAAFGGETKGGRIDVRRAEDGRVERSIAIPGDGLAWAIAWARDGIVVLQPLRAGAGRAVTVSIVDPESGNWRPTGFEHQTWATLTEPRADGQVMVRVPVPSPEGERRTRGYLLRPVDARAARVGEPMTDSSSRPLQFSGWSAGLSPDGRFATVVSSEPGGPSARIVDLSQSGPGTPVSNPASAVWLDGNRLMWTDQLNGRTRLFLASPGAPATALREWSGAELRIEPSPDGRSLLVSAVTAPPSVPTTPSTDPAAFVTPVSAGVVPEQSIFLATEARWEPIAGTPRASAAETRAASWVGSRTVSRTTDGIVYFEDLDGAKGRRFVLGSEADLR